MDLWTRPDVYVNEFTFTQLRPDLHGWTSMMAIMMEPRRCRSPLCSSALYMYCWLDLQLAILHGPMGSFKLRPAVLAVDGRRRDASDNLRPGAAHLTITNLRYLDGQIAMQHAGCDSVLLCLWSISCAHADRNLTLYQHAVEIFAKGYPIWVPAAEYFK